MSYQHAVGQSRVVSLPQRGQPMQNLNEADVLRKLRERQALVTVQTKSGGDQYSGPIIWSDIGSICLRIKEAARVFQKAELEFWDYDPKHFN